MSEYIVRVDGQMPCAIYERELTEIVRCRDCKHFEPDGEPSEVYQDSYWCDKLTVYMPPNGFCPWGKRREVE